MLAQRPPLGWNTWNTFGQNINEQLIFETADALASRGFRDAGYVYLVIDDSWSLPSRDADGNLVADPKKFPHGMKAVADYVHSKGLKFGMYSCAGVMTCCGFPASFGHEYQDARLFASFEIDYLKYDYCFFPKYADTKTSYLTMAMALRACGREILFSACNWGTQEPWDWMRSVGAHMYRSTPDIYDSFESTRTIIKDQFSHLNANAPGCYNDLDMLTVGIKGAGITPKGSNTYEEYETQFAFWCLSGSPLIIGCDVRNVGEEYVQLLTNPRLLELDQDPDCRPLLPIFSHAGSWEEGDILTFMRQLSNGETAFGLFNLSDKRANVSLFLTSAGIPSNSGVGVELTDYFTGEVVGTFREYLFTPIEAHRCKLFRGRFVSF